MTFVRGFTGSAFLVVLSAVGVVVCLLQLEYQSSATRKTTFFFSVFPFFFFFFPTQLSLCTGLMHSGEFIFPIGTPAIFFSISWEFSAQLSSKNITLT